MNKIAYELGRKLAAEEMKADNSSDASRLIKKIGLPALLGGLAGGAYEYTRPQYDWFGGGLFGPNKQLEQLRRRESLDRALQVGGIAAIPGSIHELIRDLR